MAYSLRAFLGHTATLETLQLQIETAVMIPMEQDVGMIPITSAMYQTLKDDQPATIWDTVLFRGLSQPLVDHAVQASVAGTIAYAEAEYFNGEGYQAVVVWQDGAEILGPYLAYKMPLHDKPINRVLRYLGIRVKDAVDEFDTLGLGACRRTDDWVNRLNGKSEHE